MPTKPNDASGEILHGYLLESLLGRGGMGTVYKARHQRLTRQVAIKVLADDLIASRDYVSRFLQEAKVVNGIRHPSIVDVTDFIETEDPPRVAYVMEFLAGPPLGQFLKHHKLTVGLAVGIAQQIASALEAVHEVGVIHRDLKPDNIMFVEPPPPDLAWMPDIKILDFGIAKQAAGSSEHKTATGMVLGTPAYMAPEQIGAESVSPATDVYALAEIFYEMVAGQRAFVGSPRKILELKVGGSIPELELPPGTPGAAQIQALVRACLAVDRKDRPALSEFIQTLSQILDTPTVGGATTLVAPGLPGLPTQATMASSSDDMSSLYTKAGLGGRSTGLLALGGIALLLAVGIAGVAYMRSKPAVEVVSSSVPVAPPSKPSPPPVEPTPPQPTTDEPEVTEIGTAQGAAPEPEKPPVSEVKAPAREPTARKTTKRQTEEAKPPARKRAAPVRKSELVPW
jgi:serine/threonine-protein kinase